MGYNFRRPLLDTVSLSRKLLPGHRSYSLGNLCKDLGIEISGRHRASGDAMATVRLLELLLEKDKGLEVRQPDQKQESSLSCIRRLIWHRLEEIPEEPGIYYFHDETGRGYLCRQEPQPLPEGEHPPFKQYSREGQWRCGH
ncbi:MAG: exonuclease domain-containing protein [Marinilabiliales bacterium]|nr:exonuclease domain-containing protein [Marinilabiliales bacterium]